MNMNWIFSGKTHYGRRFNNRKSTKGRINQYVKLKDGRTKLIRHWQHD